MHSYAGILKSGLLTCELCYSKVNKNKKLNLKKILWHEDDKKEKCCLCQKPLMTSQS